MTVLSADSSPGWYVVSTLPNQEARAQSNLARQGFLAWLPAFQRARRHARRVEIVSSPMFPGYLFVRLDVTRQAWSAINSTYGVRKLISRGDAPARLPDGFVEALRADVEEGRLQAPEDRLSLGARLRVIDGPFADCVGTLLSLASRDRVTLLLSVLGREVSAVLPRLAVTAAV